MSDKKFSNDVIARIHRDYYVSGPPDKPADLCPDCGCALEYCYCSSNSYGYPVEFFGSPSEPFNKIIFNMLRPERHTDGVFCGNYACNTCMRAGLIDEE